MRHIRTTHVGSLPRSQEVTDLLFSKEKKHSVDRKECDRVMLEHVDRLVARQKQSGIDIVSCGC